jgi:hypothetical protein
MLFCEAVESRGKKKPDAVSFKKILINACVDYYVQPFSDLHRSTADKHELDEKPSVEEMSLSTPGNSRFTVLRDVLSGSLGLFDVK